MVKCAWRGGVGVYTFADYLVRNSAYAGPWFLLIEKQKVHLYSVLRLYKISCFDIAEEQIIP